MLTQTLPTIDTPLTGPWLAWLAAMAVAAAEAPAQRTNAFHMVGRLTLAFAVGFAMRRRHVAEATRHGTARRFPEPRAAP